MILTIVVIEERYDGGRCVTMITCVAKASMVEINFEFLRDTSSRSYLLSLLSEKII